MKITLDTEKKMETKQEYIEGIEQSSFEKALRSKPLKELAMVIAETAKEDLYNEVKETLIHVIVTNELTTESEL